MAQVAPIPAGYQAVIPYVIVEHAARALEFYVAAFGAVETTRITQPDGRIGHAEIKIGDAVVMLADELPEMDARSARAIGGSPISLVVYLPNVDAVVARAATAGARLVRPVEDKFYGDRMGTLEDPFGITWHVATHVEDVPPDELQRRAAAAHGAG